MLKCKFVVLPKACRGLCHGLSRFVKSRCLQNVFPLGLLTILSFGAVRVRHAGLGVDRATPLRLLSSLLGPERLGYLWQTDGEGLCVCVCVHVCAGVPEGDGRNVSYEPAASKS